MARYPSAEQLLHEAADEAGLTDFGPGDFRDGLQVLLESLEYDGDLGPTPTPRVSATCAAGWSTGSRSRLGTPSTRKSKTSTSAARSTSTGCPAPAPPRWPTCSRSTRSSVACAAGSRHSRCHRRYPTSEADDPRARPSSGYTRNAPPSRPPCIIFEVDATMEDTEILGMAFHGQQMTLPVAGYRDWWRDADLTETYHYHRRVVKLLGSRAPAASVAVQGAAPQVPPGSARRRVSRCPVRDDPPRPGQGRAVLHQSGVHDLPAGRR